MQRGKLRSDMASGPGPGRDPDQNASNVTKLGVGGIHTPFLLTFGKALNDIAMLTGCYSAPLVGSSLITPLMYHAHSGRYSAHFHRRGRSVI